MTDGHNLGGCTTTTDTNSDVEVLEAVGTEEENGFPDLKAKGSWFEELKGLSVNFDEASTGGSENADMTEDMQQDAIDISTQALEKYNIEKDIAAFIKKEFDKKYNPTWHCIVGRNFGSYVTHETKHFIYFYLGQVAILLFKSG